MITACELCAKITVENALREEAARVAKMRAAKAFAEEVISPIVNRLTEVPNHLFIGYRYSNYPSTGLYQRISNWTQSLTTRGNPKKDRHLTDEVKGTSDYSMLDYAVLNQYLAEFGFQVSYDTHWMKMTEYSTSTTDTGCDVDTLYLSMTCPLEEC